MDTRFGIDCENFNLYFEKQAASIGQQAKESLPKDVLFKLRKQRLSFFGKLFLLWKCLNKRWWIVVEDEENGLSPEQFVELREAAKRRDYGIPKAEGFISTGGFVTANKELADGFDYLNRLSTSGSYNFLQRAKNMPKNAIVQREDELIYIARFLTHYEASKKIWVNQNVITIPEWYVLIALYHGKEILNCKLYQETFRYAFQSSINKIKGASRTLKDRGYIEKIGLNRWMTIRITPLGKEVVRGILNKYAVNC